MAKAKAKKSSVTVGKKDFLTREYGSLKSGETYSINEALARYMVKNKYGSYANKAALAEAEAAEKAEAEAAEAAAEEAAEKA